MVSAEALGVQATGPHPSDYQALYCHHPQAQEKKILKKLADLVPPPPLATAAPVLASPAFLLPHLAMEE